MRLEEQAKPGLKRLHNTPVHDLLKKRLATADKKLRGGKEPIEMWRAQGAAMELEQLIRDIESCTNGTADTI